MSLMISIFFAMDVMLEGGSFSYLPVTPGQRQLPIEPSTGLELSVLWRTSAAFTLLKIQGRRLDGCSIGAPTMMPVFSYGARLPDLCKRWGKPSEFAPLFGGCRLKSMMTPSLASCISASTEIAC